VCVLYAFEVKYYSSGMQLVCCSVAILNERMDMWKFGPETLF